MISALEDMPADDPLVKALKAQRRRIGKLMNAASRKHGRKSKNEHWRSGYEAWLQGFRTPEGGAYYAIPKMREGYEQAMKDHPDKSET